MPDKWTHQRVRSSRYGDAPDPHPSKPLVKAFTVMSSDLARYDNWTVSFHRWLQAHQREAPTEVDDFLDWMKERGISANQVNNVLRRAKSGDDAAKELAKLAGRGRPHGTSGPYDKTIAPVVPQLAARFIAAREVKAKREQANIERMKSKFKAKRVVETMLT